MDGYRLHSGTLNPEFLRARQTKPRRKPLPGQTVFAIRPVNSQAHSASNKTTTKSSRSRVVRLDSSESPESETSSVVSIPARLAEPVPDPGNTLQRLGLIDPGVFWHWFYLPDRPDQEIDPPWKSRYDSLWVEPCQQLLLVDRLLLTNTVPFVLRKRVSFTGENMDRLIGAGELESLRALRRHIAKPRPAVMSGLITCITWGCHVALGDGDYAVATTHLHALRVLLAQHVPTMVEWQAYMLSDLRVACVTGANPVMDRYIPERLVEGVVIPVETSVACQALATKGVRTFGFIIDNYLMDVYTILRRVHELQAWNDVGTGTKDIPLADWYSAVYDSCLLHADILARDLSPDPSDLTAQGELVAICLKIITWEQAATYMPRCGDVEPRLVSRALAIIQESHSTCLQTWSSRASLQSLLWVLLTMTATAYMFGMEDWEVWIPHLLKPIQVLHLTSEESLRRALVGLPCARWWFTRAIRPIYARIVPTKSHNGAGGFDFDDTQPQPPKYHVQPLVFDDE